MCADRSAPRAGLGLGLGLGPGWPALARLGLALLTGALLTRAGPALATPEIQTWQTGNGARVLFVAAPELPMLDLRVVFDAGSARDGERPGLASLTAAMLTQGAGPWDADALAERLEAVGAQLGASADRDMTAVSVRSLTSQPAQDRAVETLAAILSAPRFAPTDLERLRSIALTALRQDEESPSTVAQKALYRQIFGAHPYGRDPDGTEESLRALTGDELKAFHARYYTAANAVVAIVGALDRPAAEALAERAVGKLPTGARPAPLPEVQAMAAPATERIPFPSSQTTVLAGEPGMRRGDPDYFALYLGNHILGGSGLVSLLMKQVREQRGLSYSTYSYFLPLAKPGPFLMGLQTRNDQAEQAQAVMIETLRRFVAEGPSELELAAAKRNLTGGFPLRIAENAEIVAYLAVIGFYGLPLDYLDRFTDRIESVTAPQVRDAFARRIHPDRLAVIAVGGGAADGQVSAAGDPR
jgi:zinc protease